MDDDCGGVGQRLLCRYAELGNWSSSQTGVDTGEESHIAKTRAEDSRWFVASKLTSSVRYSNWQPGPD